MTADRYRARTCPGPACYAWWTVAGSAWGFGIAGLLTIGLMFLLVGVAMTIAGVAIRRLRNRSAWMILVGGSAAVWYLAWLNRVGPGTVCHSSGDLTSCIQQWSPWPFVGGGIVLVIAGVVLAVRGCRERGG